MNPWERWTELVVDATSGVVSACLSVADLADTQHEARRGPATNPTEAAANEDEERE